MEVQQWQVLTCASQGPYPVLEHEGGVRERRGGHRRGGEGRKGRATSNVFLVSPETQASVTGAITMTTQTSLPNFPCSMKLTSELRAFTSLLLQSYGSSYCFYNTKREVEEASR